ncbi:hypothetical protein AVEN_103245-1 [Araneus ventricosus]|uniref:Uncharacterized protein n=1 Tax=Araneus ventricosus TaxID=182803 RepID=A0A4Y2X5Z9_ARAVE|nr:hypothetical protein AVEN_103245-1 [Araneus ventricosus]
MDGPPKCASKIGLLEVVKYIFAISTVDEKEFMSTLCTDELIVKVNEGDLLEEDQNDIDYFVFFEMSDEDQEVFFNFDTATVLSLYCILRNVTFSFIYWQKGFNLLLRVIFW